MKGFWVSEGFQFMVSGVGFGGLWDFGAPGLRFDDPLAPELKRHPGHKTRLAP